MDTDRIFSELQPLQNKDESKDPMGAQSFRCRQALALSPSPSLFSVRGFPWGSGGSALHASDACHEYVSVLHGVLVACRMLLCLHA